jgi:hypothetical protein
MGDIADFLAARIYDDEQAAREPVPYGSSPAAPAGGWRWSDDYGVIKAEAPGLESYVLEVGRDGMSWDGLEAHVARWDPARVLLECEAKRGILLDYMTRRRQAEAANRCLETDAIYYALPSDLPLRYLALPYRDHPEYSEAWAPPAAGTVETWGRR